MSATVRARTMALARAPLKSDVSERARTRVGRAACLHCKVDDCWLETLAKAVVQPLHGKYEHAEEHGTHKGDYG